MGTRASQGAGPETPHPEEEGSRGWRKLKKSRNSHGHRLFGRMEKLTTGRDGEEVEQQGHPFTAEGMQNGTADGLEGSLVVS